MKYSWKHNKIPQTNDQQILQLPKNAGIIILWVKTLISRNNPVEQTFAWVQTSQTLNQPPVSYNKKYLFTKNI